jgi:hypothetical protein
MRGRSVVVLWFSGSRGSLVLGFAGYGFVGSWVMFRTYHLATFFVP